MRRLYGKFINSNFYKISKRIISLDDDKKFLVSSLSYYLLISLVPLITLTFFFLRLFNVQNEYLLDIYQIFTNQDNITLDNLFTNNILMVLSAIISLYIASKGTLNYFFYINEKFELDPFPYQFFTSRIYAVFLTLFISFLIAVDNSINYYVASFNNPVFNYFKWSFNVIYIFFIILLLNYFLLRKKISFIYLAFGSFVTALLLSFSSVIYEYYLSTRDNKTQYFGILTDLIILLLYIYLLAYFVALGNQINYMIYKKEVERLPNN